MNSSTPYVTFTHSHSGQTIAAITKYRRFEITINSQGDNFVAELIWLSKEGQVTSLASGFSDTIVSNLLLSVLKKIVGMINGRSAIEDEASMLYLILEGSAHLISLDDVKTLLADNHMGFSAAKI